MRRTVHRAQPGFALAALAVAGLIASVALLGPGTAPAAAQASNASGSDPGRARAKRGITLPTWDWRQQAMRSRAGSSSRTTGYDRRSLGAGSRPIFA